MFLYSDVDLLTDCDRCLKDIPIVDYRLTQASLVRAIRLMYPGTLTLTREQVRDSVMEYRYITVPPATCRVCSFHTMIRNHRKNQYDLIIIY